MTASYAGIVSLIFDAKGDEQETSDMLSLCRLQLDEYFGGKRTVFDVPLDLQGTEFQVRVWNELLRIPFGETVSYLHIANALGDPKSTRAVGNANGKNPVPVIVPCHRIIGAGGSLVGYSGGIEKKKWLLEFERNLTVKDLFNTSFEEQMQ
ncbi:MAG TPA: methylated-DNA--[protein]-cysteine S-methyltransferase [Bacteroidia bacterium]|jgi:methylated-DNA-[protein]-cysteine S-methyltransferase|nr:methylated-DNA--[protein]-cysteine S-methyltransferase [Bacteroidia bacterium]